MKVRSFKELEVYQLAFELQQAVFELSKTFPTEERYSLTDQIRRSSRSVGANIAEAWRKRRYPAHFASKLTDADGEKPRRPVAVLDSPTRGVGASLKPQGGAVSSKCRDPTLARNCGSMWLS